MKAEKVQVDVDFEDDGLFGITVWVDQTPPHYVSVSRDAAEDPDLIYFEAEDQIHGFKTDALKVELIGNDFFVALNPECPLKFHWTADRSISIRINEEDLAEVRRVLGEIMKLGSSF
jgi:hypothetical protein